MDFVEEIGRGGQGIVYLAEDHTLPLLEIAAALLLQAVQQARGRPLQPTDSTTRVIG